MEYEAYKVRGYGFGLKQDFTGLIGRYPTPFNMDADHAGTGHTLRFGKPSDR